MKPATTVTKVCRILGEFKHRPSVGVTDLTRRLDLLPSDIHGILTSLQIYGYVEQNPETKGRVILVRLAGLLNAPTHLAMLGICEREVPLFKARPGATTAAHSTALGKAILAGMDPQTFECALDRSGVRRSTGKTITNWPTCRKRCNSFASAALPLIGKNRLKGVLYWLSVAELLRNGYRGCWGFYGSATFPKLELNRLASQVDAAAAELWYELGYDPGSLKERRAG